MFNVKLCDFVDDTTICKEERFFTGARNFKMVLKFVFLLALVEAFLPTHRNVVDIHKTSLNIQAYLALSTKTVYK